MTGADSSFVVVERDLTMTSTTADPSASDPAKAAEWDLTSQISPHLDLHMMFPLLEYVDSLITADLVPYTHSDVAASRLSLLRPTHMVDYAMDIYRELHGAEAEIPQEMEQQWTMPDTVTDAEARGLTTWTKRHDPTEWKFGGGHHGKNKAGRKNDQGPNGPRKREGKFGENLRMIVSLPDNADIKNLPTREGGQ